MRSRTNGRKQGRLLLHSCAAILVVTFLLTTQISRAQTNSADQASAAEIQQQLGKYPLKDFGELFTRLQKEIDLPSPRHESQLLPLLPQNTVFYVAFPNYGTTAEQALRIFREERQSRPALTKWWQSGDMAKTGPQMEMAVEQLIALSQYLGDEIVVAGAINGDKAPGIVLLAQVRKPGFKEALERSNQLLSGATKPAFRVVDKQGLAMLSTKPHDTVVLVRSDYVITGSNPETVRALSRQLDSGVREFAATPFGQRVEEGYKNGVSVMAGVDLQKVMREAPIPPQQNQALRAVGLDDVRYLTWEYTRKAGQATSEGELSFTHPRHGVASWLAAPRELGSLDFASPKATVVASIVLKKPGDILDDVRTLATASNPNAFAQFDLMQAGLGFNLKQDLLDQLSGEITFEVDDITDGQPAWKAILKVNDAARLQQTLNKLLLMAPVSPHESEEKGVTYHSLTVPSPAKPMEVGYAFVDGYLVIASSGGGLREAVRLHRDGGSLGKSSKFLASLPTGHGTQASALYYSDSMKALGLQLSRISPELAQSVFHGMQSTPTVTCAYADESAIRGASASQGMDAGMILVAAAVAIPNLLRAKNSANEAAAMGDMRTIVTAQVSYSATYPARGFSRDLASLGVDPSQPDTVTPKHAGLIDFNFAKPTCTGNTWCEKAGYKFTFAPVCPKLLCQEFVAVGTPVAARTGARNFCATSDGVVRFKVEAPLIAPISAAQCRTWTPLQ